MQPPLSLPPESATVPPSPGWWGLAGDEWVRATPTGPNLCLDTETLVKWGALPVMAACWDYEAQRWYFWVGSLLKETQPPKKGDIWRWLIPLESGDRSVRIYNHAAMYDAIRVQDAYTNPGVTFWDSLSAHIAVRGTSTQQVKAEEGALYQAPWEDEAADTASLVDCYNLYCQGSLTKDDKLPRQCFVDAEGPQAILDNWATLTRYALSDVLYTTRLVEQLYPQWVEALPDPDSQQSHPLLNGGRIPVMPDWYDHWDRVEAEYQEVQGRVLGILAELATDTVAPDTYTQHLDWGVMPKKGVPRWKNGKLTLDSVAGVSLLRLSWEGRPLTHHPKLKWGTVDDQGTFTRLPHPQATNANVGSPLGKDWVKFFDKELTTEHPQAFEILRLRRAWAFYRAFRSRIHEVMAVDVPGSDRRWVIPNLRATGTFSRRCSERLWLTTTTPTEDVPGSEVYALVRPPEGYMLVGADVDQQELKIGAFFADWCSGGEWGSTPFSRAILKGDKSKGTDLHTLTAVGIGLDSKKGRQIGKVINFLTIYLGGVGALCAGIQAATDTPAHEALTLARLAIQLKRGRKVGQLYYGGTDVEVYNAMLCLADGASPAVWMAPLCYPDAPRTPFSGAYLPKPLRRHLTNGDFTPSRANWTIQSTGVDMRDYVVCEMSKRLPSASLVLTRHDEYWFMVREGEVEGFNRVFQEVHRDFWQRLADTLGLGELPPEYLWFSAVSADYAIRKEPDQPLTTPTYEDTAPTGWVLKNPSEWA